MGASQGPGHPATWQTLLLSCYILPEAQRIPLAVFSRMTRTFATARTIVKLPDAGRGAGRGREREDVTRSPAAAGAGAAAVPSHRVADNVAPELETVCYSGPSQEAISKGCDLCVFRDCFTACWMEFRYDLLKYSWS